MNSGARDAAQTGHKRQATSINSTRDGIHGKKRSIDLPEAVKHFRTNTPNNG